MKTLLVLEDEAIVMKLLRLMLRQYGVVEATSAEQALDLFRSHSPQVDLLVADLTLPASSGVQVALSLRSENPNLPVILTSGFPVSGWNSRDSADLRALGADSVAIVQKPFQGNILSDTVRGLIGAPQLGKAGTA